MNRKVLFAVIGSAVVAAAVLIAVSATGGSGGGGGSSITTAAVTEKTSVLAGIPQDGTVLGKASAPATVYEFADLQCPYCGEVARDVIPSVVQEYVRTGRIKLDFQPLEFLGPDSDRGARAVMAAGKQDRAWDMLEGLYAVQGAENSGWMTEDLLREVGGQIPGLNVNRMLKDMDGVTPQLQRSINQANELNVQGTPTFFLQHHLGRPQQLQLEALSPEGFRAAIEPYLT
jgi:protein-disulfide isomerase